MDYLGIRPPPRAPEFSQIIAIAGEELRDMLCRRESIDGALATAQNRAEPLRRANLHH